MNGPRDHSPSSFGWSASPGDDPMGNSGASERVADRHRGLAPPVSHFLQYGMRQVSPLIPWCRNGQVI